MGKSGEGGSVVPEEVHFLDEQVLRVSGGLREVEDALARVWGGEREDGDSDMEGYFQARRMFEFEERIGNGSEVGGICKNCLQLRLLLAGSNLNLQSPCGNGRMTPSDALISPQTCP